MSTQVGQLSVLNSYTAGRPVARSADVAGTGPCVVAFGACVVSETIRIAASATTATIVMAFVMVTVLLPRRVRARQR
jgi:hypothetical protein